MKTERRTKNSTRSTFFFLVLTITFFPSCSKIVQELIPEEPKVENILVEESPWVFSRYEISTLEDDDGSGLSSQEIENDMNQYLVGVSFAFNEDATGFLDIPEEERRDWIWDFDEDVLTTYTDTIISNYTFLKADRNQMSFEGRTTTIHLRDTVQYSITHVGKYIYK